MGALSDKANQQSKFLIIEKGSSVVVKYLDFRFVPNQKNPDVEDVQYKVERDGAVQFWTNGSAKIMRFMDKVQKGAYIRIYRNKWVGKDGSEDKAKSSYDVELCDEMGAQQGNINKEDRGNGAWDD